MPSRYVRVRVRVRVRVKVRVHVLHAMVLVVQLATYVCHGPGSLVGNIRMPWSW